MPFTLTPTGPPKPFNLIAAGELGDTGIRRAFEHVLEAGSDEQRVLFIRVFFLPDSFVDDVERAEAWLEILKLQRAANATTTNPTVTVEDGGIPA